MKLVKQEHIKVWEGFSLKAYMPTPNDVPTIGWGHTHGVKMGDVITKEKAQEFFDYDTAWAVAAVNREVKVGLTQNQFDALVSFVFNVGEGAFKKSTLLRKLNAGDYQGAAEQLPRWNKQKGKVLRGLTRRRASEMELFLEVDQEESKAPAKGGVDEVKPLKSLAKSKEVWAGVGAAATGVTGLVGSLTPVAQTVLVGGLVAALLMVSGFLIFNRLHARNKGQR